MAQTWSNRNTTFDVFINDSRVMFSGLSLSQGLDQVTSVLTFDLVNQPTIPDYGDSVRMDFVNLTSGFSITQFSGSVYSRDTESYPHRISIVAQGPLGKLVGCIRDRSDGDLNLTGLTDGEAVEAILTYCGVDFDSADIADAGYELGALEDVYWHADGITPASTITDEIDRVFYSKLMDIGNGRVLRAFYNLASIATEGVRNYIRGSDTRLFGLRKARGEVSAIQNHILVQGVSIDCGSDESGCTCQPIAEYDEDNATLDEWIGISGARAAVQTVQSDLIQDEAFAAFVAHREGIWKNRTPFLIDAEVMSEPQLYPARIVTFRDSTYGVDFDDATPFTITRVEVRHESTSISLTGGPPGADGTVTSTVEELCNDTEGSQDIPGSFDDPPFTDLPDLGGEDFTPFPDDGWEDIPPTEVNTSDPFIECTSDGLLDCDPLDPDLDICREATVGEDSCTGTPPDGVCEVEGWHKADYPVSGETYDCQCDIDTNLYHTQSNQDIHYYTDADGNVQKLTVCSDPGDLVLTSATFTLGTTVGHNLGSFDRSDIAANSVDYGAGSTICVTFNYRMCFEGDDIVVSAQQIEDGEEGLFSAHDFTLHAVPGRALPNHISVGGTFNVSSEVDHVGSSNTSDPENTEVHHAYGSAHRNPGAYSLGPGIPLNTDLVASICWVMTGDNPKAFWDTGVDSGYYQNLPYLNELHPLPGEPTNVTESGDHDGHIIKFRLLPGADENTGLCTLDCPGPMVWGIVTGYSTCEENPDYVPGTIGDDH